ncbi:hypothetical protein GN958_ATG23011 [Phytophthora infestans]|uniref:Uncharacterized protein n=1 Tax=Phytophthora infestans TaxID=4787 RepID=A0A8S9THS5_PHYIN|nr:hypothetical protein GN958_ATG23011 [Phytophthora infestans]
MNEDRQHSKVREARRMRIVAGHTNTCRRIGALGKKGRLWTKRVSKRLSLTEFTRLTRRPSQRVHSTSVYVRVDRKLR